MKPHYVEWSAPDYRRAGHMWVKANTAQSAIRDAKKVLGSKVKRYRLTLFVAYGTQGNVIAHVGRGVTRRYAGKLNTPHFRGEI